MSDTPKDEKIQSNKDFFLTNLTIDNFRSFEKQRFDFANVNYLVGPNSSGKSTLIKALLFLREAYKKHEIPEFDYDDNETNLGTFDNILGDKSKREFSFSFTAIPEGFKEELIYEIVFFEIDEKFFFNQKKEIETRIKKGEEDFSYSKFVELMQDMTSVRFIYRVYDSKKNLILTLGSIAAEINIRYENIYGEYSMVPTDEYQLAFKLHWDNYNNLLITNNLNHIYSDIIYKNKNKITTININKIKKHFKYKGSSYNDYYVTQLYIVYDWKTLIKDVSVNLKDDLLHMVTRYASSQQKLTFIELAKIDIEQKESIAALNDFYFNEQTNQLRIVLEPFKNFKDLIKGSNQIYIKAPTGDYERNITDFDFKNLLISLQNIKNRHQHFYNYTLKKTLKSYLNLFEIAEEFDFTTDDGGKTFKFYLINKGIKRELIDLGYGYNRLLKIIFRIVIFSRYRKTNDYDDDFWYIDYEAESLNSQIKKTYIFIEEPELHLHPKLQSKLADFFHQIHNRYNVQIFIETHSEYLIRKTQVIQRSNSFKDNDGFDIFRIYYFNTEEVTDEPRVKRIDIDEKGNLTNSFGPGFYDEAGNLYIELLKLNNAQNN